jgi:nucleoside-diphosphate-sugar epimerase
MTPTRRDFLAQSSLAGAFLAFDPRRAFPRQEKEPPGLRLLILGGTAFLGPEIVAAAKARDWTITLFNRGKTNPHLFPELEKLHGDRDGDLKSLEGRKWDAVIDTSGYVPRHVRDSATLLRDAVKHYVFISTISVYEELSKPGMDESAPVAKLADETTEKVTGETYGALKALCEKAAQSSIPDRTTVIRPGLIVGPGDSSDRFTYWPVRVDRGGEVLAPGDPQDPLQFIDVRDLAAWTVRTVAEGTLGVFNATGPTEPLPMGALLEACKKASGSDATLTWVNAGFLAEHKVAPWSDMPVWIPPVGEETGASRVSAARALAKGLVFRPVEETVKDTLAWWKGQPEARRAKLRAGIPPEREAEVLRAWHEKLGAKKG